MANNVPSYYQRIFNQHLKNGVPEVNTDRIENIVHVSEVDDLPDPQNGVHQLESDTGYHFNGVIFSDAGLELAARSPLLGSHGSLDGFVHTGGGTAITADSVGYFASNLYLHAPGGTMYDLTADTSKEILVESVSHDHRDAPDLGDPIADMGTVDGYRVPKWGGCNFENFDAGLTFTGTSEKVFISGCPFRDVSAANVSALEFDANFDTQIVSLSDNYVTGVQADTKVVSFDANATFNGIFQYKGNTHDNDVVESNILGGDLTVDDVGVRVSDSFPLPDSTSFVGYALDTANETAITQQATSKTDGPAYAKIAGQTTISNAVRFGNGDNTATFEGKRNRVAFLTATASLSTGNTDVVAVAWFKNNTLLPQTAVRVRMNQQSGGIGKNLTTTGVAERVETGDTFTVKVANLTSTTNVDVGDLNAQIST